MPLRIVFMGTPEFSVAVLDAVAKAQHRVVAVYSQPPRPAGRGMAEQKSAVHRYADAAGLPVLTPPSLKPVVAQTAFAAHAADVAVVVAYGLLLPGPILAAPAHGCLNLHASALPRWRGAAPIQRAIMAGDRETAVMVMRMDEGLDTGPVCLAERVPIGDDATAGELHDELARRGAALMVQALGRLEQGALTATPQATVGITYAAKIEKREARVDFGRPAREVHDQIRGLSPWPGAFTEISVGGKTERIKLLGARLAAGAGPPGRLIAADAGQGLIVACGEAAVQILEVQRAGKRPMPAAEFLRGTKLVPGDAF